MAIERIPFYLSDGDLTLCQVMAFERARKSAVFDLQKRRDFRRDSKRTGIQIDFEGVVGEMVFSKFFHYPMNNKEVPDGGIDFVINRNGRVLRVDVKFSRITGGLLLVRKNEKIAADVLFLVTGNQEDRNSFFLCGWTTKEFFIENHTIKDLGHGPVATTEQKLLYPVKTF